MRRLPVFLLLAALLASCQKQPIKVTTPPGEAFKIIVMDGGGFTGEYTGCTLSSDGGARFWLKRGAAGDSTLGQAQASVDRIRDFKKRLQESGALKLSHRETGNMTATVRFESIDTLYTWSWPGAGENERTPGPFRSWYSEVQDYCRQLADQVHSR